MTPTPGAWSDGYHAGWHDSDEGQPYGHTPNPRTDADDDARARAVEVVVARTMAALVGRQIDGLDKGRSEFDRGQQHALLLVHRRLADMAIKERNA